MSESTPTPADVAAQREARRKASLNNGAAIILDEKHKQVDAVLDGTDIANALYLAKEIDASDYAAWTSFIEQIKDPATRSDAFGRLRGFAPAGLTVSPEDGLKIYLKSSESDPRVVKLISRVMNSRVPDHIELDEHGSDVNIKKLEQSLSTERATVTDLEKKVKELEAGKATPKAIEDAVAAHKKVLDDTSAAIAELRKVIAESETGMGKGLSAKNQKSILDALDKIAKPLPKPAEPATA